MSKVILLFVNILFLLNVGYCQWLSSDLKKSVLLIEQLDSTNNYIPLGTGFLIGKIDDFYLVTNRHISTEKNLFIRFNLKAGDLLSFRYSIDSLFFVHNKDIFWGLSDRSDIAILKIIDYPGTKDLMAKIDISVLNEKQFKDWDQLNEGDDIFILGFPLSLGVGEKTTPLVRTGIIALKNKKGEFLIDCPTFPGNSGSPVFLKPSSSSTPLLIGIVNHYISNKIYSNPNVNIPYEENTGLSNVISSVEIKELFNIYYPIFDKNK